MLPVYLLINIAQSPFHAHLRVGKESDFTLRPVIDGVEMLPRATWRMTAKEMTPQKAVDIYRAVTAGLVLFQNNGRDVVPFELLPETDENKAAIRDRLAHGRLSDAVPVAGEEIPEEENVFVTAARTVAALTLLEAAPVSEPEPAPEGSEPVIPEEPSETPAPAVAAPADLLEPEPTPKKYVRAELDAMNRPALEKILYNEFGVEGKLYKFKVPELVERILELQEGVK